MTALKGRKKAKKERPLVNGHPIRFRRTQQLAWTGLSILLGAGFVAGIYWIVLQQHYPFMPGSGSLKLWWDNGLNGLIRSPDWPAYRHGVRDGGEPAVWAMVGAILLGKANRHARLLPNWLLVIAPVVLLALIVAGTVGITWLIHFGPLSHVPDPFSWQELTLGLLLGRALHFIWSPIGNTIRYRITANAAVRNEVPLWVRYPLLPPAWREQWAMLREEFRARGLSLQERTDKYRQSKVLAPLAVSAFLVIAIVGDLAKWAVAHGVHIPGMN